MKVFTEDAVQTLRDFQIGNSWMHEFETAKNQEYRYWSRELRDVDKHARALRRSLLLKPFYSPDAIVRELRRLQPRHIAACHQAMLRSCRVLALIEGNISHSEATELIRYGAERAYAQN